MPGGLDLSAAAENAPQNSGRERDSLITVEISLIARFNSLQGAQKFPVPMRRELASKYLVRLLFLLAADARLACIFPASREIWLSETGSLETASSSRESAANLIPRS